jgi:putative spermidine/putrescine transport system permease protein
MTRRRLPPGRRYRLGLVARLLPLIIFFSATVGVGLVHGALQSLALAGPPALDPGRAGMSIWYAYQKLFLTPELLASLGHTFAVALVAAVAAVAIGAPAAYLLWRSPGWVRSAAAVYRLPIILPHVVVAFIVLVFWSRTGIIAAMLVRIGLDPEALGFSRILFGANGLGIILAYVYKTFPFVMLLAMGVLDRIPDRLITTAHMLGAGPVRTFFVVVLPQLMPMLNQVFIILFLYTLGGFDIPWLLGASRPQMVPMTVYALYFQGSLADRSIAMAALTLLAVTAFFFVAVYSRIARRLAVGERPI